MNGDEKKREQKNLKMVARTTKIIQKIKKYIYLNTNDLTRAYGSMLNVLLIMYS